MKFPIICDLLGVFTFNQHFVRIVGVEFVSRSWLHISNIWWKQKKIKYKLFLCPTSYKVGKSWTGTVNWTGTCILIIIAKEIVSDSKTTTYGPNFLCWRFIIVLLVCSAALVIRNELILRLLREFVITPSCRRRRRAIPWKFICRCCSGYVILCRWHFDKEKTLFFMNFIVFHLNFLLFSLEIQNAGVRRSSMKLETFQQSTVEFDHFSHNGIKKIQSKMLQLTAMYFCSDLLISKKMTICVLHFI